MHFQPLCHDGLRSVCEPSPVSFYHTYVSNFCNEVLCTGVQQTPKAHIERSSKCLNHLNGEWKLPRLNYAGQRLLSHPVYSFLKKDERYNSSFLFSKQGKCVFAFYILIRMYMQSNGCHRSFWLPVQLGSSSVLGFSNYTNRTGRIHQQAATEEFFKLITIRRNKKSRNVKTFIRYQYLWRARKSNKNNFCIYLKYQCTYAIHILRYVQSKVRRSYLFSVEPVVSSPITPVASLCNMSKFSCHCPIE